MIASPGLHSTPTTQHRFHLLDALRGVAAIVVVLWHMPFFIYPRGTHSSFLAVDFFFCLSGFVIAFSYERRLQSTTSLRDFAAARIIRLYPTYLLGLFLGLAVYLRFDWRHITPLAPVRDLALVLLAQVFMLPDYFVRVLTLAFPFNYPAWSLFFELLANIIYAVLVRSGLARTWHLAFLIGCSILVLWRFNVSPLHVDVGWRNQPYSHAYLGVARVLLSFVIGVLLLRLYRARPHIFTSRSLQVTLAFLLTAALFAALQSPVPFLQKEPFLFADLLVVFPAIVFLGAHIQVPQSWIPLCAFLGDTSYPVYLLHVPILRVPSAIAARIFYSPQAHQFVVSTAAASLYVVFTIALALILSKVAVNFFDTPVRRFLRQRYNVLSGTNDAAHAGQKAVSQRPSLAEDSVH